MMEDMQPQSGEAAATILPSFPLDPRTLSDDAASTDQAVDTTAFRLLDLPTEIVTQIFEHIVPAPLPTGTGLPLSKDILTSREALVNLCKTSKICNKIAMPLVYRNIIITKRMQMAKLVADLLAHQDRCSWMRSVAVPVDLVFRNNSDKVNRAALKLIVPSLGTYECRNQRWASLEPIDYARRFIYKFSDDLVQGNREEFSPRPWIHRWFYLQLLRITLYLGNRIEDVLITAPHEYSDHEYYRQTCLGDLEDITPGQFSAANSNLAGVGDIFKALRRIRTQSDPHGHPGFCPQPLALEFVKSRQWEFLEDSGCWMSLVNAGRVHPPEPYKYLNVFSHVTELSLLDSKTHPAWLRCCFRYAKNLEKFMYTTWPTNWNHRFQEWALTEEEGHGTLQQALEEVRDTLTDLRLGLEPWYEDFTAEDQALMAPHRVDVSQFPRLKRIDIDLEFTDEYDTDSDHDNDINDQDHNEESSSSVD